MINMLDELYDEKNICIDLLKNLGRDVIDLCNNNSINCSISFEIGDFESSLEHEIHLLSKRIEHINYSIALIKRSLLFINRMIRIQEEWLLQNPQN